MKTLQASPSSSPRGESAPGGVVSRRYTPGPTPLPRWLTVGAWGLTLVLGVFFFSPDGEISWSGFVARILYLGLVGVLCGLLVSQEHRRAHQRQGERINIDQLLAVNQLLSIAALENARLISELRAVGVERRTLLHVLIRAQEHERLRVADEWHDRLSTKLFDLLQGFRSCQQLVAQRVPEGKERFERLAAEIDAMAAFVRRFVNEIYPSVLDDFGFIAALREYIAEMEEQEPFDVTVQAEAIDYQLPTEANLTLFRITQEALQNVRKHARARHVQIALVQEHAGVSLMIKDDGQGFNPEQSLPGHYGLLYMREHAEAYGGTFRVVSSQGQGTEVRVDFPTRENARRGRMGEQETLGRQIGGSGDRGIGRL